MENQVVWVDIPVTNLARATKFYSAILGHEVIIESMGDCEFGLLPHAKTNVAGCLYVDSTGEQITDKGPTIYLNCNGRLAEAVAQVEDLGGKVIEEHLPLGEHGARAMIIDSEGNKMALHTN